MGWGVSQYASQVTWSHTPSWADTSLGRHPLLGRHPPPQADTPSLDTVNDRAVRILLECILVLNITKILPLNSVYLGAIQLSMISEFEFKF